MNNYAEILRIEQILQRKERLGKIVCASGAFDPLHPGHTSYLIESKKYGDTLIVLVKGDNYLRQKKGKPFQNLKTRCEIVASIRNVDYVVPFEILNDTTVNIPLRLIQPDIYTKGGDSQNISQVPEFNVCQELGIELVIHVGNDKIWSSSQLLEEWFEFRSSSNRGVDGA